MANKTKQRVRISTHIRKFSVKEVDEMIPMIQPVLYTDPQQQKQEPCPVCGCECYGPSFTCLRCERSGL